jgi:hypothetical protein
MPIIRKSGTDKETAAVYGEALYVSDKFGKQAAPLKIEQHNLHIG